MREPLIQFSDFSFRYASQKYPTLKHINLSIYPGEKILILGPSGSGKSTLANCINGLIPFSIDGQLEGSIKIAGGETRSSSIFHLSQQVGTVLQDSDAQFISPRVDEDIAFALENEMMPYATMEQEVTKVAGIVGMSDFLDRQPFDLSGGQKQRVSLAGVLNDQVQILLFDEPLASLDPKTGVLAMALIHRMNQEEHKTVIIIEHRLEDVLSVDIDRVILLKQGEIIADVSPDELLGSGLLKENGIREPLYLTALKFAGIDVSKQKHLSSLKQMDLKDKQAGIKAWLKNMPKRQKRNEHQEIVSLEDVSYSYDQREFALDKVSLSLQKGEKVCLIGKNGAGKSTLAKILTGIVRPLRGKYLLLGEDGGQFTIKQIGQKVGYVMQNPNQMLIKDKVKAEVALGLEFNNIPSEELEQRCEEVLTLCGLWPMRNWPLGSLSYGQRKRVTIASILALKPSLIILDEPTAGQDYRSYTEIMTFLEKLNQQLDVTILFITHDMHLAIEYTDRAIVLADGKLLADAPVYEVLANNEVIEKANLKQTSLYHLAQKLKLDPQDFIERFIGAEREERGHV